MDFDVIPTPMSIHQLFLNQEFSKLKKRSYVKFEKKESNGKKEKKIGIKSTFVRETIDETSPIQFSCKYKTGILIKEGTVKPTEKLLEPIPFVYSSKGETKWIQTKKKKNWIKNRVDYFFFIYFFFTGKTLSKILNISNFLISFSEKSNKGGKSFPFGNFKSVFRRSSKNGWAKAS